MGRRLGVLDIIIIIALIIVAALVIYYLWWLIVIIIIIGIGYYLYKRHKAQESRRVV
jgi:hypothetical protein